MRNMRKLSGQMLVEVLIAFVIAAIALLAITQISTKSLSNSYLASRQTEALRFAQAGMEKVKEIKKINGLAAKNDARFSAANSHCYNGSDISTIDVNFCPITGTIYEGRLTFTWTTVGTKYELGMLSEVRWTDSGTTWTVNQQGGVVFEN